MKILMMLKNFDYIVGVDVLEESESPVELLTFCRSHLNDDGRLLLGTENRLGIKYFWRGQGSIY